MPGSAYSAAWLCFLATLFLRTGVDLVQAAVPPHIIFIVADDLGWNDVGFHGSLEIPTPNIDALAYSGVILNNYYVQPICTPSRSAIMSGRHPIHTGLQHDVIYAMAPYGLPLDLAVLPQYLNSLGYSSEAVGKWHLGLCNHSYTPTHRGFDHHYGYWTGHIDYYDHTAQLNVGMQHTTISGPQPYGMPLNLTTLPEYLGDLGYVPRAVGKWHLGFFRKEYTPTHRGFHSHYGYWSGRVDYYDHTANEEREMWGYDFRRNMDIAHEAYGQYATDLFTAEALSVISAHNSSRPLFLYLAHLAVHSANPYAPLQAPEEVVDRFSYIKDEKRRMFAGMLAKLDESVGAVVSALQARRMLDNSVIVFTTDNGGPAGGFNLNAASNWPLRGTKASMWEGGMRGAGFVWSPLLQQPPGTVAQQLLAVEDWLPTLYAAAVRHAITSKSTTDGRASQRTLQSNLDSDAESTYLPSGGDASQLPSSLDGVNVWPVLSEGAPSPHTHLLHNIDPVYNGSAAKMGDWKLIHIPSWYERRWDAWFGPSGRNMTAPETQLAVILQAIRDSPAGKVVLQRNANALDNMAHTRLKAQVNCSTTPLVPTFFCRTEKPCLFHIPSDPCEQHDVSDQHPDIVQALVQLIRNYNATAVPILNQPADPAADPKYWDYNWNNWQDYPAPVGVKPFEERRKAPPSRGRNEYLKHFHFSRP